MLCSSGSKLEKLQLGAKPWEAARITAAAAAEVVPLHKDMPRHHERVAQCAMMACRKTIQNKHHPGVSHRLLKTTAEGDELFCCM